MRNLIHSLDSDIMNYYKICIALLSLLLLSGQLSAQKRQKVYGEYIFYVPETMSLEQARHTALERAKIQILAEKYGTFIDATSTSVIKNENGNSTINTQTYSKSLVRGEWLETIGEPEYSTRYENGQLVLKIRLNGIARAITESTIDVKTQVLRNGIDDRFEGTDFNEGDEMFISFLAPVEGYLTIYLYDGDESVYRLLPYSRQSQPSIKIEDGKRYIFFSYEEADGIPKEIVDEYVMTCSKDVEINRIYIIFSPNRFTKAADGFTSSTTPRTLRYENFTNWLSGCRMSDKEMTVKTKDIIIRKKN